MTDREATFAGSDVVQRQVATVMKALAPMGGTKEQSDACIALGRLAAWAEAAMHGHHRIEMRNAD